MSFEGKRIEWTKSKRTMSEGRGLLAARREGLRLRAQMERRGAGRVDSQGAVDRIQRRLVLEAQKTRHKSSHRQRRRVVCAATERSTRVTQRGDLVGFVQSAAGKAQLVRPRQMRMSGGIIC
jgi:hypothetical protein